MSYFFAIVGHDDRPLYEMSFSSTRQGSDGTSHLPPAIKDLSAYIVHASLDVLDEEQVKSPQLFFKNVDRFYSYSISAFVTPGRVRFLLLHEPKNEEAIRQFFYDIWDLYVKTLMSPFYEVGQPIENASFDANIRQLCRKYL